MFSIGRGEKTPTPKISALLRKQPVLLRANVVLTKDRNGLTMDILVVKCTGRRLVVKRPGVLGKVQMLNLVLGVGVFSLLPCFLSVRIPCSLPRCKEKKIRALAALARNTNGENFPFIHKPLTLLELKV